MTIMPSARFLIVTVLLGSHCLISRAQFIQPPAPGQIGFSLSSEATSSGEAKLKSGDTTFRHVEIGRFEFGLKQQFGFSDGRNLTLGLDYSLTGIDVDRHHHHDTSAQIPLPDELQSLGATVRYSQKLAPQWLLFTTVGTASHVTDTGLLSEGWGVNTSVLSLYNRSQKLSLMLGIAYNSRSADWRIVPVLGVDWRPTEKWSIAIGFPKTGVTYKLNSQLSLALAGSGGGGNFYVKDDPLPGIAPRSLADSKLEYTEARLGFSANWKIDDTFRISGTVGHILYRQFKYIDRNYTLKSRDIVPYVSLSGTVAL